MPLYIKVEIIKWLSALNIIDNLRYDLKKVKILSNGKYEITDPLIKEFESGRIFGDILKKIIETTLGLYSQSKANLNLLRDSVTQASKLYNWNIIADYLKDILGYQIDKDVKDLIIAGDSMIIAELLDDVYQKIRGRNILTLGTGTLRQSAMDKSTTSMQIKPDHSINGIRVSTSMSEGKSALKVNIGKGKQMDENHEIFHDMEGKQLKDVERAKFAQYEYEINKTEPLVKKEGYVDLSKLNPKKDLGETETCLEFILIGLSRHLKIKPKQAAFLLSENNKYLSHVLIKGSKGDSDPIITLLQECYMKVDHLLDLMKKEEHIGSVKFILSCYKPGLLSRFLNVSLWSARILSKLGYELSNYELIGEGFEWFVTENGGFHACVLSINRHQNDIVEVVASVIQEFTRHNIVDFYTVELRRLLHQPRDYIKYMNMLLPYLNESKITKDALLQQGVVEYLIEQCFKCEGYEHVNDEAYKLQAFLMLGTIWKTYPLLIEEDEDLGQKILATIKRCTRERKHSIKLAALTTLFDLLDTFATDKNPYAPVVYKMVVFSFIEAFHDNNYKEFLGKNFIDIFQKFSTIPVNIFIEAFIKQIQLQKSEELTMIDLEILICVINHRKLTVAHGLMIFDTLGRLFIDQIIFVQSILPILKSLCVRFIETDAFKEFLIKFIKILMVKYYKSLEDSVYDIKQGQQKTGQKESEILLEKEIVSKHKRATFIQFLKDLILLQCTSVNSEVINLILFTNYKVKSITTENSKGLVYLLNFLVQNDQINYKIKEYEDEMNTKKRIEEGKDNYDEKRYEVFASTPHLQMPPLNMTSSHIYNKEKNDHDDTVMMESIENVGKSLNDSKSSSYQFSIENEFSKIQDNNLQASSKENIEKQKINQNLKNGASLSESNKKGTKKSGHTKEQELTNINELANEDKEDYDDEDDLILQSKVFENKRSYEDDVHQSLIELNKQTPNETKKQRNNENIKETYSKKTLSIYKRRGI